MSTIGYVLCPHLKGSNQGIICGISNSLIRDMADFTIRLCMSQRHEACSVYMQSLQNVIEQGSCLNIIAADLR